MVIDFLSILRQKYTIYANTNGMISETTAIVLNVNSLDELLVNVKDDERSAVEG